MGKRVYRVRKPYKGERDDAKGLEKDLQKDLKEVEAVTEQADRDLTAVEKRVTTLEGVTVVHQQKEAQKTDLGTVFSSVSPTWTDLPQTGGAGSLSVTLTTKGGRVKVQAVTNWESQNANRVINLRLMEDTTAGTQLARQDAGNSGEMFQCIIQETFMPAAGSHTYKVQGQNTGTAGSLPLLDNVSLIAQEIPDAA